MAILMLKATWKTKSEEYNFLMIKVSVGSESEYNHFAV